MNPWVVRVAREAVPDLAAVPVAAAALSGPGRPQGGLGPPDMVDRLPCRVVGTVASVWWVGAHGGAGESTLAGLLEGSAAGGHAWPAQPRSLPDLRLPVVLVARTSLTGLCRAQAAARQWACGDVPDVELLGLVLSADAPARLPRELRELAQVVGGGTPRVWRLPWVDAWRTERAPRLGDCPAPVRRTLAEVAELAQGRTGPLPGGVA